MKMAKCATCGKTPPAGGCKTCGKGAKKTGAKAAKPAAGKKPMPAFLMKKK
jgi:hypothetical protein